MTTISTVLALEVEEDLEEAEGCRQDHTSNSGIDECVDRQTGTGSACKATPAWVVAGLAAAGLAAAADCKQARHTMYCAPESTRNKQFLK